MAKNSRMGQMTAPKIQGIFSNFYFIFMNVDNMSIDFGRLILTKKKPKFYKRYHIAEFHEALVGGHIVFYYLFILNLYTATTHSTVHT